MKNSGMAKDFLTKALLEIPDDFALSEVRFHIRSALMKIENIEKRRKIREASYQNRKEEEVKRKEKYFNPLSPKQTIELIDSMIESEKKKLTKKDQEGDNFETFYG